MLVPIDTLPDHSQLWIFPASRALTEAEASELRRTIDTYLTSWEVHHVPAEAAQELRYNQFLIIAANPDVTAPSGCSIDDMTRAIKSLSAKFGVDFFGAMKVFYRADGEVRMASRSEFKSLASQGIVDAETLVFDNSITTLGALRSGQWELPVAASWHATMLPEAAAVQ